MKPTRVNTKHGLEDTWNDGTTMWVVHGPDGIRVFTRGKYGDADALFTEVKPYIENRSQYEVYAN
jgi:hypothetical protein